MTATFVERVCGFGDYENDGGKIPPGYLSWILNLYNDDLVSVEDIRQLFELTTPQADQLDEILATRPVALLTVINAYNRARWADLVHSIFEAGEHFWPGFSTAAEVETALGI